MRLSPLKAPAQTTKQRGFTIVELQTVIVIIGILAAMTIVAYNGISSKARASALVPPAEQELGEQVRLVPCRKTGNISAHSFGFILATPCGCDR